MDPVSWTGLRLSQARVQLLMPIIAAPGPANFFFPSTPPQELRIALCFCDPHLNKLKGVTSGPVSQTRVCEPPIRHYNDASPIWSLLGLK